VKKNHITNCFDEVGIWKSGQDRNRSFCFRKSHRRNAGERVENVKDFLMQTYTIVLPVLMGYIVWLLKRQKHDRDANSKGTMLLLRVQLIEYHEKWMKRGYITKHGLENFIEMYNAYHALGGNGMVTHLLEEVKELPIKN